MRIAFEAALVAAAVICGVMWFVTDVTKTALVFYMFCKGYHTPTVEEFFLVLRPFFIGCWTSDERLRRE